VLHVARRKIQDAKIAKNLPSAHHCTTSLGYIFTTKARIHNRKKNLLNSNISPTCPYNMANFGPLTAEIVLPVWGTPANFNGFRVLPSLLQRHRPPEANQTLHDVWLSPELVHYIYIFGGSCPWQKFAQCKIHFTSKSCVLLYWQHYCTALQQRASAKLCSMVQGMELWNFCRGWHHHVYPAARPSFWASDHILVTKHLRYCLASH